MSSTLYHCYKKIPLFIQQNLAYCDGMGEIDKPNFIIDRQYFNNYLVMFVEYGTIIVEQYGNVYKVKSNQTIVMDLQAPHKYYFGNSKSKILWFHFNGPPFRNIMNSLKFGNMLPCIISYPNTKQYIHEIFDMHKANLDNIDIAVSPLIYSAVMNIIAKNIPTLNSILNPITDFQKVISQYINANINQKITLDNLTQHACMSKSKFCKLFKNTFGQSAFEYIIATKIEYAQQMLLCSNDSVLDISNYLKFNDQSYFCNTFRKITGLTPSEFRLKNISNLL